MPTTAPKQANAPAMYKTGPIRTKSAAVQAMSRYILSLASKFPAGQKAAQVHANQRLAGTLASWLPTCSMRRTSLRRWPLHT